jgi:peroxiredoxin
MMKLKKNETIPNSEFFIIENGSPVKKNTSEFFKDKKVVLFGLPGAYTSVCSAKHLPGYVNSYEKYKAKGIELIVCISVNDPFVMDAWGKSQNVTDKIIMIADPFLSFTKAIGADVDKSARGLGIRSNRYTMLIDNLKVIKLQEEDDAGTCEISAAENFLKLI